MQDSEKKRILRLVKGKWTQEELVFLVGVTTSMLTVRAQNYVASGQIILVATSSDLLKAGPQESSLVLVHDRTVEREVARLPGKVEFVDLGVLKQIVAEAAEAQLLTVEREAARFAHRQPEPTAVRQNSVAPSQSDPMKDFAMKFFAEQDKDGVVTAIAVKRLAQEVEGFALTNPQLVKAGWLEPWRHHAEAKVSGYTATDKLRHYSTSAPLPEAGNAYERALLLVASEPSLRERMQELKDEITSIEGELLKVDRAKAWLNQGQHF